MTGASAVAETGSRASTEPCSTVSALSGFDPARDLILDRCLAENIALRCLMGGGCDANNDGLHTTTGAGRNEFCIHCGETTKGGKSKPWFNEARLERTIRRLAASAIEAPSGVETGNTDSTEGESAIPHGDAQ